MNKAYEISGNIRSSNGIYDAFYAEIVTPALARKNDEFGLVAKLKKLHKALTGAVAKRLVTVAGATLSILGIVGIAGGIQHGTVSLLGGILVAGICLGTEFLCLKSLEKNSK